MVLMAMPLQPQRGERRERVVGQEDGTTMRLLARITSPLLLAALLGLLAPLDAPAEGAPPAPLDLAVSPPSSISYHLDHTLHEVIGVAKLVEGSARLLAGGAVEVEVRVRVAGFDSGNASRDSKMLEVTEAARFPLVVLKAAGTYTPPTAFPATAEVVLAGTLAFHGLVRPVAFPARVTFTAPGRASASATFSISLKEFQVEPPSLLFMSIKDRAVVTASLALQAASPSP
jgi:polyisoprenoid-binding protein YceI